MPEMSLRIILAHERKNPGGIIPYRKKSPGQRLPQEAGEKHVQKAAGGYREGEHLFQLVMMYIYAINTCF
jgi:hypothetical protein